jgi:uncharacterized protein
MATDVLMVRIYLSEADHGRRTTLMQEILSTLHDRHAVRGVTVFRGIAGFDADGEIHADDLLRLNLALPLVIEFFDEPEAAEAAIQLMDGSFPEGTSSPGRPRAMAPPPGLRSELNATAGARDQWRVVPRTWRACSEVARALCRLSVFLCRVRLAFEPASAPVLGMAAADAAPGGGLLCAEAGGDVSASMRATPIEAKVALRIVVPPRCSPGRRRRRRSYTLGVDPAHRDVALGEPNLRTGDGGRSALRQRLQNMRRERICVRLLGGEVEG